MTTSKDKAERVRVARMLLKQGYGYIEVVQACQEQYHVSEKTAKNYVRDARLTYVQTLAHLQEDAFLDYGRTEYLLQKAMAAEDSGLMGEMLDRRQRLRKEIARNGSTQSQFSSKQGLSDTLERAISELTVSEPERPPGTI